MKWVEEHPFKVAFIVSLCAVLFGIPIHAQTYNPPNWVGFLIWCPSLFVIPLSVAFGSYLSVKVKEKKCQ